MNEKTIVFVYEDGESQKVRFTYDNDVLLFSSIQKFLSHKSVGVKSIVFI